MRLKEAEGHYGKIVFETVKFKVRAVEKNGEVCIVVHKVLDGVEQLPLGYIIGHNSLDTGLP